ncbi:hypothetical protein NUKP74_19100 [Klebsiella quasipneumoniae]|nr:hypothetical protein NUKP74_19100 [Klebsiella quasipneumoniae]
MLVEIEHLQQLRDRQGYPAVASGPQSAGEVVSAGEMPAVIPQAALAVAEIVQML